LVFYFVRCSYTIGESCSVVSDSYRSRLFRFPEQIIEGRLLA